MCVQNLSECYEKNMCHISPYNLHFTGVNASILEKLNNNFQAQNNWCVNFHKENCVELFQSENLVYLSSEGIPLTEYDSNKIYVIGAYVNMLTDRQKHRKKDRTATRARQLGVETRRLQLYDFYK